MKKKSGVNMSDVKRSNRSLILNQIKNTSRSRKDIANRINLTPAAVTILVNELIEQGCIKESGQVQGPVKVGRKQVLVEIDKFYKYAIGVSIEGNAVDIAIGNLKAEIIAKVTLPIIREDAEKMLKIIAETIIELIEASKLKKSEFLGIGVGIVGVVDAKEGISKNAYGIWNREVNIAEFLNEKIGLKVVVQNNVRALALAEMDLMDNRKMSNMVFIKYGPGIGSAIIVNDDIYEGSNYMSGEIGHMIMKPGGELCKCGQRGCLETVASVESVLKAIEKEYNPEDYSVLSEMIGSIDDLTEEVLLQSYIEKDEKIVEKVEQLIGYFALGIANLFKMYDPNKIVIYGKMFNEKLLLDKLEWEIRSKYSIEDIEERIEISQLKNEKVIGGIIVAVKDLFYNSGAMFS